MFLRRRGVTVQGRGLSLLKSYSLSSFGLARTLVGLRPFQVAAMGFIRHWRRYISLSLSGLRDLAIITDELKLIWIKYQ